MKNGKRIYIAGPMSGHYGYNFHTFDRAEHDLQEKGWSPINPAQMDRDIGFDPYKDTADEAFLHEAMKRDCAAIIEDADAMAMLPGWENSTGARGEFHLAKWKHIPIYSWPEMEPITEAPPRKTGPHKGLLPSDAKERKQRPIFSGVLQYFPDAIAAVAHCSWIGNEQHNPGEPLHWSREKSSDHEDCLVRHLMERGTVDGDGCRHSAKMAWRALAILQLEIESNTQVHSPHERP